MLARVFFLSHSPKIYSMWLDGYSALQKSMCTIKTTYSWSSKDIPADSKDGAIRSLHSNVSWYLSVLPGCSLQGSFPLPPPTRGLCLAPEGMSSYTHTWSSAHWEPCWTACTCTPNLSWICMKTHTDIWEFSQLKKDCAAAVCWKKGGLFVHLAKTTLSVPMWKYFLRAPIITEANHLNYILRILFFVT